MRYLFLISLLWLLSCQQQSPAPATLQPATHADLVTLYRDWRAFEQPPRKEGAPDYSLAAFEKRRPAFDALRTRLLSMDTTGWTIPQQVDWTILMAEMNGYDFHERVLRPWERDPAFYATVWMERSDVPAHEGTTHHAILDVWTYTFPLAGDELRRFDRALKVIPALHRQAKINLTGNARELWIAGIRDIRLQSAHLAEILDRPGVSAQAGLVGTIRAAIASTDSLVTWLEAESPRKTGPSGVGKENYSWYLRNVHLVPLSWEDEVMILKRELARAWTGLKLEEHRNRKLPPLPEANTPEVYDSLAARSARSLLAFLSREDMLTVKPYFEPALKAHLGSFIPKEKRNFFSIGAHIDPRPLYSHFYHWFELARMDLEPHENEIRRSPLLYNIFDNRNEGMATAVEEMFMQAGLYDDDPRVREIVYIMIAQRAARGLGSLYAQANIMTMEEAGSVHENYTPRGWMKTEKDLRIFEQHLYMRQPGYGTSYITGKYLLEALMAEMARQLEQQAAPFQVKAYFDRINAMGCIPVSLAHWEMTGINPLRDSIGKP